jgi:CheY-like chemotaxis protein/HPt (histidine-containing phosphotransfer) domain-containing protein
MNGVIGMTRVLKKTTLSQQQRHYVDVIEHCGESLLTLINDLLDFSKIEAGKLELTCEPFDFRQVLEKVVEQSAERAEQKGVALCCFYAPELPTLLRGDAGRLRQILINLLGNALKFTDNGSITVRVTPAETAPSKSGRAAFRVSVADTGIGISAEGRHRLFQSFSQVDQSSARKYGGTGLGLAISKQLCDMMEGSIGVESEPGVGSTFWFTVSLETMRTDAEADAAGSDATERIVGVVGGRSDEREILCAYLRSLGYSTIMWAQGADALDALSTASLSSPPSVMLLDHHCGDQSASELARSLKAHPVTAAVPLVLLTGVTDYWDADRLTVSGFTGSVVKPVRYDRLAACLTRLVDGSGPVLGSEEESPRSTAEHFRFQGHVLLAEDNPVNQEVARLMLEGAGLSLDLVESGLQAVEAVRSTDYDLILMDWQMPGMDGLEAAEMIRREEAGRARRRVPIVALTAHATKEDEARCLSAGMDGFLTKPFSEAQLSSLLKQWLPRNQSGSDTTGTQRPFPSAPPAATDTIDPGALEKLRALQRPGQQDILAKIVAAYLHDSPTTISAIRHAVMQRDFQPLFQGAHRLKSSSAFLGAARLVELCARLETIGAAGQGDDLPSLVAGLEAEYERVVKALGVYVPGTKAA